MSFENVYRSKEGTREIEKITEFIGSLVIKNQYEADYSETSESASEYYKYLGSYTRTDSFNDFSRIERQNSDSLVLMYMQTTNGGEFNEEMIKQIQIKNNKFLMDNINQKIVIAYLKSLRAARIYNYDEKNIYYRQFMGIPNTDKDIITVLNYDKKLVTDPEYIPIHWITALKYPETYAHFILKDGVSEIIAKYPDLNYLKFLNSGFTAYYLRELPNYSIIKYKKGSLSSIELNYFFKSYNKAKTQVLMDYIDGFDKKQPAYNILMIQNLLYYTVINYSNSYIERFTLCDYTEENLDDILNSHGYSKLTEISSVELKQKIVRNLPDLIENKANNYVLELILDKIIDSGGSELKRYYIEKKYSIGDNLEIKIDTGKSLENSIDLVFKEVPAISQDEFSATTPIYHDYDSFTIGDNAWGGVNYTDSNTIKTKKRQALKRKILKLNFNSILTKYITLTRTIDILEAQRNVRDSLFIMLNYFDINQSPDFFNKKIQFGDVEATPAAIYAAMCWVQQMKFYGENADNIIKDNCIIGASATFRRFGRYAIDKHNFENKRIVDGKVVTTFDITPEMSDWKVADFLMRIEGVTWIKERRPETVKLKNIVTLEEVAPDSYKHAADTMQDIGDFMTVYRFFYQGQSLGEVTTETSFNELLTDYQLQYPSLIDKIENKLMNSHDIREYEAWLFLKYQSRKNNSVEFIFKGHDTFSDYMNHLDCGDLAFYIQGKTNRIDFNEYENVAERTREQKAAVQYRIETLHELLTTLTDSFKEWVTISVSDKVYEDSLDDMSSSYVGDMKKLFDEFLSTYSELYTVNYKYRFGNEEKDGLDIKLLYNPINIWLRQSFSDLATLNYRQKSTYSTLMTDELKFEYEYYLKYKDYFVDAINGDLTIDPETLEYIVDAIKYEPNVKLKQLINDIVVISDRLGIKVSKNLTDDLILSDNLKIEYKEI